MLPCCISSTLSASKVLRSPAISWCCWLSKLTRILAFIQKRSGDPNPQYFSKSTAVQMGGVLPYKWEAYCSTNGRRTAGFPFLRSLEARKVRRYKWGAYCRTNWRCTAVLFRQVVGVGVSETLPGENHPDPIYTNPIKNLPMISPEENALPEAVFFTKGAGPLGRTNPKQDQEGHFILRCGIEPHWSALLAGHFGPILRSALRLTAFVRLS